jgi:hypothetical protein
MLAPVSRFVAFAVLIGACLLASDESGSQEALPAPQPDAPNAAPAVPNGIDVQARGPVHEAFATPSSEARPTQPVAKKPPAPLEEMPPEDKPAGDMVWIGGYYAWDDDRQDFLWVSGCWRARLPGKEWVPGYWREIGEQWQWVPGFWASVQNNQPVQVTYNPEPPAPPPVAAPPPAPALDMFFVPGYWMWMGDRYAWRAGYYTRIRPGYVYVASHYRWTPYGYVFVPGYWDLAVAQRGLLYAPVTVNPNVVGVGFVYTPCYAVTDTLVLDAMFIRPSTCHYYFGDYYGPRYVALGFEPCVVYSRRYYEPIFVYRRWEYRDNPRWLDVQVNLYHERSSGRAPLPPRTLIQQTTIINNVNVHRTTNVGLAPAHAVLASRGQQSVRLDAAARADVHKQSVVGRQTLLNERHRLEPPTGAAVAPAHPRVGALHAAPVAASPAHSGAAIGTSAAQHGNVMHPNTGPHGAPGTAPVGHGVPAGPMKGQSGPAAGAPAHGLPGQPPGRGAPARKQEEPRKKEHSKGP